MLNEFITVSYLMTFSGMLVILTLIVQFTKSLIKTHFSDYMVRAYTFAWAVILVMLTNWYNGMFDVAGREIAIQILLTLINAIILTLASMGGYELVADPKAEKKKPIS